MQGKALEGIGFVYRVIGVILADTVGLISSTTMELSRKLLKACFLLTWDVYVFRDYLKN